MSVTGSSDARIKLLIVDDHAVVRSGLRLLLETQPDIEVVGEAADAGEGVKQCLKSSPDIVLLDLSMPAGGGLHAIKELKRLSPAPRIVVLTMHNDATYLRHAVRGGAEGYVIKQAADTELIAAIRAVATNKRYLHPTLAGELVHESERTPLYRGGKQDDPLSNRERQIVCHIALGFANKVIAEKLHISVKTVEAHRARILEKLGLKTRADLVRYALENNLLSSESP